MEKDKKMFHYIRKKLTQAQIIALGYFLVIAAGTLILMLPIATKSGEMATPLTALFTATSATCVTGLVVWIPLPIGACSDNVLFC